MTFVEEKEDVVYDFIEDIQDFNRKFITRFIIRFL
jgi:hypothetical protein